MKKLIVALLVALVPILFWLWTAEEKPISPVTFEELEEAVMDSNLTEIQEAQVRGQFLGERVRWTGVVTEVTTEGLVSVDIDGLASDVEFYLSTEEAVKLSSGATITFVGTIEEIDVGFLDCDVTLDSVTLE